MTRKLGAKFAVSRQRGGQLLGLVRKHVGCFLDGGGRLERDALLARNDVEVQVTPPGARSR